MKKGIYILDGQPLARRGIQSLLEQQGGVELLGASGSVRKANQEILRLRPDLLISEMTLPDGSAIDLIRSLVARVSQVRILVCSANDETIFAERAIKAGAHGYVMKTEAESVILKRVQQVLDGGLGLNDKLASRMLRRMSGASRYDLPVFGASLTMENLSGREMEVFEMLGRGLASKEIAGLLGISPRTVDTHRARIREKLGFASTPDLLRAAYSWNESGRLAGAEGSGW
ncbi:response regulator transcription factor [Pelagicoccus sp. SDUM812003]|uniref:response regulator transcription factor n=1 Tax=Pelagicoccus sp. SDUM812003 TaxID=3041267 RepID=UPI002810879A|nr:response regulator transcription factor [Pelagicoccus sp. SDUM812003]MDQ8204348.1 response regulator transcription factor [Pelagicoccus sp. SDUM812003]